MSKPSDLAEVTTVSDASGSITTNPLFVSIKRSNEVPVSPPSRHSLVAIPAFSDNYFWLLHDGESALVVDPGDAGPVLETLKGLSASGAARTPFKLDAILVTHHHADHTGGVAELVSATGARVWAPARGRYDFGTPHRGVQHGDEVQALGLRFQVLETPGHTLDHVAYFCDDAQLDAPLLFCGDTLFSGGCGRLFEGTPGQMLASLDALAELPGDTQVCCAHEYTLSNLRFALAAEPGNAVLAEHQARCQALRAVGQITLPSTVQMERAINPFLRVREPALAAAARQHGATADSPAEVFAALRQWKNMYR